MYEYVLLFYRGEYLQRWFLGKNLSTGEAEKFARQHLQIFGAGVERAIVRRSGTTQPLVIELNMRGG